MPSRFHRQIGASHRETPETIAWRRADNVAGLQAFREILADVGLVTRENFAAVCERLERRREQIRSSLLRDGTSA
jgi:methylase of polypeptide subunit release factors